MSVAICVRCGAFKSSAFLACPSCGSRPRSVEDLARQILLTDIFSVTPSAQMEELAAKVRLAAATGEPLLFSPDALREAAESINRLFPGEALTRLIGDPPESPPGSFGHDHEGRGGTGAES